MGAGIALECRYRFPGLFEHYSRACESGLLKPGLLLLWTKSTPWVLCFPTKAHWKAPSELPYIEAGLQKFADTYRAKGITSVAFPRLGTSHGGLAWDDVRPLMERVLSRLPELLVEIYSLDPRGADPLFDELVRMTSDGSIAAIQSRFDLRAPQARAIGAALESGEVCNLLSLQQAPGVGPKTTERLYRVLCDRAAGSHPQSGTSTLFE